MVFLPDKVYTKLTVKTSTSVELTLLFHSENNLFHCIITNEELRQPSPDIKRITYYLHPLIYDFTLPYKGNWNFMSCFLFKDAYSI